MKILKNLFIAVAASLASVASYADIVLTTTVDTAVSGEFTPVTVTAEANGGSQIGTVSIVYRTMAGGETAIWVTNALTEVGGVYKGEIPPLPVATVEYYATATDAAGASFDSEKASYAAGDTPTTDRYWDFSNGTFVKDSHKDYAFNYHYDVGDGRKWTAQGVMMMPIAAYDTPGGTVPTLAMYNYPNEAMVNVTSPRLEGGVGTIYFTSKLNSTYSVGELQVQISLVDEPAEEDWMTIRTYDFPRVTKKALRPCHAEPIVLNNYMVKRVRFLRTRENDYNVGVKTSGVIVMDNIAISRPPARVEMEEQLRNPGYPSQDQFIKMRVKVTDTSVNTPTVNRRVRVFYKWTYAKSDRPSSAGWTSVDMEPIGGDIYEGTISTQRVGFINYYYRCDFDGYYYSRDPDGPEGVEPPRKEELSPNFWSNGETLLEQPQVYSQFQVRPYRSEYENVAMISEPASTTVSNMTLVGNETWQCVTLVTGVTNLNWKFVGYNRYTDDAKEFQQEPVIWGEADQAFVNPPLGGFVEVAATNGIQAELEYTGFLLMRFNAQARDYIVKRAVWQDFDDWQASQEYYEQSLGLYATTPYKVDFDKWIADGYVELDTKGSSFENDEASSVYDDYDTFTYGNWIRSKSRIIRERQIKRDVPGNVAVDIQRGGFIGNSGFAMTYGLSSFDYRVRSSLADNRWALYKDGTGWTLPQTITPTFYVADRADSEHYLGVIFCYQDGDWGETPGYYELRFLQGSCTSGNDNWLRAELWRQDPGTMAPVMVGQRQNFSDGKLAGTHEPTITVSANGGKVTVNVKMENAWGGTDDRTFTDSNPGALTTGGTVGFGSYDASPVIKKVDVKSGGTSLYSGSKAFSANEWYLGGKRLDDPSKTRWEIGGEGLTRAIPKQTLQVYYTAQTSGEKTPDTSAFELKNAAVSVQSLKYAEESEDFSDWKRYFVQLRYVSGEGNVVVDDVSNSPWRGVTRDAAKEETARADDVPYYDWTEIAQQDKWLADNNQWAVLEGWTTNALVGSDVTLEKSRANPDLIQALVTPVMTNGLGSITFTYSVTGAKDAKAIYAVERTTERMIDSWVRVATYTNDVGAAGSRYTKVAEQMKGRGRLRIRLLQESGDVALHIDNVIAKDYPPRDKTTWLAYNVRITDKIDDPTLIYNGAGKSAFLNNSTTAGTAGTEVLTDDDPYVQSPEVGTGIGEIAFMYRAYTPGAAAEIIVKVAPSEELPEDQWTTVTNFTVTSSDWVQFANPKIFDLENKILRIYSKTTGEQGRFAIDNILVTEPVRAGYEIFSVRLDPGQPLVGTNTAIEAEIGRFMMNPKNVELYATYHVGTNEWGYKNWWKRTDPNCVRLHRVGPEGSRLFRTVDGMGIPAGKTDEVVQFVVWGVHSEIDAADKNVIFQGTNTFVNPSWYAPIDLNKTHAESGWSPYYFVYSCAPGQVWFNELNYFRGSADYDTHEYLEIAGPAKASIAGWRIEVVDRYEYDKGALDIPAGTVLPNDDEGWGFFVWGSSETPNMDVKLREELDDWFFEKYGGLRLYRSNGALEQKICWGSRGLLNLLMDAGYEYIGLKGGSTNSMSIVSKVDEESGEYIQGSKYADFTWTKLGQTPGERNDDGTGEKQVFLTFVTPGAKSFLLSSSILGDGTQNGEVSAIELEVESGKPFSVLYKANEWNRISELKANGVVVPAAAGQKSYSYDIASMKEKVALQATFAPWTDNGYDGVPVSWLSQWTEAQIAAGDPDAHSLADEYLLNTDPTQETTVKFFVSSILVGDANAKVTVKLDRREADGTDYGDGTITGMGVNGILRLYSTTSLDAAFQPDENAGLAGAFDGKTEETFELPLTTGPFFKAAIEPFPVLQ